MKSTIEGLQWRYAVKKFDSTKELSKDKIEILKEAFNLSASSYGLQPVKLLVIKNKELQNKLVPHAWNQAQIADASHLLVFCVQKDFGINEVEEYFKRVQEIRNTSDEIINPFKSFLSKEVEKMTKENIYQWNKNQAYLALGNLLTVCGIEEIDSCPMEGFDPVNFDEILNLEEKNLTSVLVMPVGYRASDDYMKDLKKVRKKINEVVLEIN